MRVVQTDGGFTLAELLISIALMALVTTMMAAGLHIGTGVWRTEQAESDSAAQMLSAHEVLVRLLSQAEPVYASPLRSDPTLAFDGGAQYLKFIAPMRSVAGGSILAHVLLDLDRATKDGALQLAAEADLTEPLPAETDWPHDTVLTHVSALHIRYFGQTVGEESTSWHLEWHAQPRLPSLIEILIDRKGRRSPMSFTAAPRLTHSPACHYDLIGPACNRP